VTIGRPFVLVGVLVAFAAAVPVHDFMAERRVHPVSLVGGLALLASAPLRFALAQSAPWHAIAAWLVRWTAEARY
jgi:hypothetical protein